ESSAETVMHCDGYDSVCLQPFSALLEKFAAMSQPIVFAYELQSQPEYWLALQTGLMIANRDALLSVFDDATLEALFPDHFNDLYQIQSMYSWNRAAFALDLEGTMF